MAPVFDLLVLTASDATQARGFRMELARRRRDGALAGIGATLVLADPKGKRAGSGSSTLLAVRAAARRFGARTTAQVRACLATRRVAIIHCGGDSRRLPAFAAQGKVFAPLPGPTGTDECVFTRVLSDLLSILPRPGQVIVGAGDMMLSLEGRGVDLCGAGITVLAGRHPHAVASRHGVFVTRAARSSGLGIRRVQSALQKPTLTEARRAGAIDDAGTLLVDTGVMAISADAAGHLLRAAGEPLLTQIEHAQSPALDLYDHIVRAAMPGLSLAQYAAPYRERGAWAPHLARLHRRLRSLRIDAVELSPCRFGHAGTTREYLATIAADSPRQGVLLHSTMRKARRLRPHTALVECRSSDVQLAGLNLVVGWSAGHGVLALPSGWCAFETPLRGDSSVLVVHGIDDDFKTAMAGGGTLCGIPLRRVIERHGLSVEDLFDARIQERSLWTARLWPVARAASTRDGSARQLRLLQWLRTPGARPSLAWRRAERVSLAELVRRADRGALARRHQACVEASLAAVLPEHLLRTPLACPIRAHRALRDHRAAIDAAEGYATAAARAHDPLDRARLQMALCDLASRALPLVHSAVDLRAAAMASVGDAVSASITLPRTQAKAGVEIGQTVHAHAPVRIDLAGGWSDTPPICNEVGGTVLNAAILLNGTHPIKVVAQRTKDRAIRIHSVDQDARVTIRDTATALAFQDPRRWDALPKAALVLSGIVPADPTRRLAATLDAFGGGVSLTVFSGVPRGSGLGTSSIFGATMLAALSALAGEAVGFPHERGGHRLRARYVQQLVVRTSLLEQLIGTRGGWQDQVGGLFGGFKVARTHPGARQHPTVEPLKLPHATVAALRSRSVLLYTGVQRMAKDILETVVARWLLRDPAVLSAIPALKAGAEGMRSSLLAGDIDAYARHLADAWALKCTVDPASTNAQVQAMVKPFTRLLSGWTLAGAGGGGFILMVAKDAAAADRIRSKLQAAPPNPRARVIDMLVADSGLDVSVL